MRVWIVNPYGTLPSEGWREYRSAMLARALATRGHEVTWFISNFEHRSKTFRKNTDSDVRLPSVKIRCLPTSAYRRNISLARIQYEKSFGRSFLLTAGCLPLPDAIILAEPSLFFGAPVRKFAENNSVPLIVDILDLWPEMFSFALPRIARPFSRLLFAPLYAQRRRLLQEARAIATCTTHYSRIARESAPGVPVSTFYLGVNLDELKRYTSPLPLVDFAGITCVYAGTLGEAYDIQCLIDAAALLSESKKVRFIIAGAGPLREAVESLCLAYPDTAIFLGELPPDQLGAVYAKAQLGLCTYAATSTVSMPVKLFDYLGAGLGVVTSLSGEISELIKEGAGKHYPAGDAQGLAQLLTELAATPRQVETMQAAASRLGERFDQQRQHAAFVEFIEQAVNQL